MSELKIGKLHVRRNMESQFEALLLDYLDGNSTDFNRFYTDIQKILFTDDDVTEYRRIAEQAARLTDLALKTKDGKPIDIGVRVSSTITNIANLKGNISSINDIEDCIKVITDYRNLWFKYNAKAMVHAEKNEQAVTEAKKFWDSFGLGENNVILQGLHIGPAGKDKTKDFNRAVIAGNQNTGAKPNISNLANNIGMNPMNPMGAINGVTSQIAAYIFFDVNSNQWSAKQSGPTFKYYMIWPGQAINKNQLQKYRGARQWMNAIGQNVPRIQLESGQYFDVPMDKWNLIQIATQSMPNQNQQANNSMPVKNNGFDARAEFSKAMGIDKAEEDKQSTKALESLANNTAQSIKITVPDFIVEINSLTDLIRGIDKEGKFVNDYNGYFLLIEEIESHYDEMGFIKDGFYMCNDFAQLEIVYNSLINVLSKLCEEYPVGSSIKSRLNRTYVLSDSVEEVADTSVVNISLSLEEAKDKFLEIFNDIDDCVTKAGVNFNALPNALTISDSLNAINSDKNSDSIYSMLVEMQGKLTALYTYVKSVDSRVTGNPKIDKELLRTNYTILYEPNGLDVTPIVHGEFVDEPVIQDIKRLCSIEEAMNFYSDIADYIYNLASNCGINIHNNLKWAEVVQSFKAIDETANDDDRFVIVVNVANNIRQVFCEFCEYLSSVDDRFKVDAKLDQDLYHTQLTIEYDKDRYDRLIEEKRNSHVSFDELSIKFNGVLQYNPQCITKEMEMEYQQLVTNNKRGYLRPGDCDALYNKLNS